MKKVLLLVLSLFVVSCGTSVTKNTDAPIAVNDEIVEQIVSESENESSSELTFKTDSNATISAEFISESYGESLVGEVELVDCALSGGTETSCYKFTVAPDATRDHEIGPWCPRNISDTELAGGIWPDDGKIYEVTGDFVKNLAVFYGDDAWQLYDTETGKINVTDTQVSCEGAAKPDVEDAYKNHCVECSLTYMDKIPNMTYTIPVIPKKADSTQNINNQSGIGVSFNGTKFDASAPAEQILAANTIAPFDDCGGHINLNVGYHYHEATGCSKEVTFFENHEAMIGFAFDGFPMFRQISSGNTDELDACGGHEIDGVYHYHIAETGSNEFLACYAGEYGCVSGDENAVCDASASSSRQGPPNR